TSNYYLLLYQYIGGLIGANMISISGGSSKYVNTLAISSITGDEETDQSLFRDARTMTEKVFDILMTSDDQPNGMDDYQRTLFDVLIDRVYRRVGVLVDDPRTWHLSSECTYYTMYEELLDIARDKSST